MVRNGEHFFAFGWGVVRLSAKVYGDSPSFDFDLLVMTGLVATTVYAEVWSCFGGLGRWVLGGAMLVSGIILWKDSQAIAAWAG